MLVERWTLLSIVRNSMTKLDPIKDVGIAAEHLVCLYHSDHGGTDLSIWFPGADGGGFRWCSRREDCRLTALAKQAATRSQYTLSNGPSPWTTW